jgi:hypothetical protein
MEEEEGSLEQQDDDINVPPTTSSRSSKVPVRDETYYMADGSCVFLVEETLFNV